MYTISYLFAIPPIIHRHYWNVALIPVDMKKYFIFETLFYQQFRRI